MHDIVVDEFDRHLNGDASEAFYGHLAVCERCRAEVAAMESVSVSMRELRQIGEIAGQPAPGFYNRVADRIVEQQSGSLWGVFSPGPAFFRKIAFASLLFLAGLGGFLVTREPFDAGADAVTIMAEQGAPGNSAADPDRLLVTLATYRQ